MSAGVIAMWVLALIALGACLRRSPTLARRAVGEAGWNPDLVGKEQTIQDLMEASWFKEVFLDSDTKVALISGAPL